MLLSKLTVMRNMGISHHQVVIANDRHADVGGCRAMNCYKFPDGVEIADNHPGFFSAEFQILRRSADRAKLENVITSPICV